MTKHYKLAAEQRTRAGKGVARALRREEKIPAVIYGDKKEPLPIQMPAKEVTLEYYKGGIFTNLCDLEVGNDTHQVLVRDVQTHPVSGEVLHVDFLRVNDKTRIAVMVPVHFTGQEEAKYTEERGILNAVRHEVELVCKATNIPEALEIDVSQCEVGDSIKISDVNLPSGTAPAISDRDFTIATIAAPKRLVTAEEEAAEAGEGEEGAEEGAEAGEGDAAEGGEEKAAE